MTLKKLLLSGRRLLHWSVIVVVLLFMTGCADVVEPTRVSRSAENRATLEAGHPVGQTFVAYRGGLSGMEVFLSPSDGVQGHVILHLREGPYASTDILTASITLSPQDTEGFYPFSFSPILGSHSQYYYAGLEYQGTGHVEVPLDDLDTYLDGTFYAAHVPQASQLTFRLNYDVLTTAQDIALTILRTIGYGGVTLAILFFSGYWMVRGWAKNEELDFTATLILSSVAFLAAWMAFLVWIELVLNLQTWMVRLVVAASGLLGLLCFIRDRDQWRKRKFWLGSNAWATLALWIVVASSIGLRLFIGRGMVVLPGADAYHHTLIVQLFEEHGGIPSSYEPYAPLVSFSYHFGFHSIVALFRWLFETELLVSTKTVALVLNGATAAVSGLLAERLTNDRRAGVFAAAFVGLIVASPLCLLRWSRFTQTTGLFFLPAGVLAWVMSGKERGWWISPLLIAAMFFSHYRVLMIWLPFAVIVLSVELLRRHWYAVRSQIKVGIFSLALAIPWLVRVVWVQSDPYGLRIIPPMLEGGNSLQRLGPAITYVTNWPVLVVSLLVAGVVWWKKELSAAGRSVVAWCLALVGWILALQTVWFAFILVDANTVLLSLPIPLGVLMGLGGGWLWSSSHGRGKLLLRGGMVTLLILGVMAGTIYFPSLMRVENSLMIRPGDLVTMDWITHNIPGDALFFTNGLKFPLSPGWIVGIDGGYWIPLLTHRAVTVPPMIYLLEWGDPSMLPVRLEASSRMLTDVENGGSQVSQLANEYGVTHIFAGTGLTSLDPSKLVDQENVVPVYRQDRIWIFGIVQ